MVQIDGFHVILGDALAGFVHAGQIALGLGVAVFDSLLIPIRTFRRIFVGTEPHLVHDPQAVFSVGIVCFRCRGEILHGFFV